MDCVFCKIKQGEITGLIVGENEMALAFLDTYPVVRGHIVVIPKVHVETILDLSSNQLHGLFDLVKEVTARVEIKLKTEGFNIGINMREASGNGIEHLHVHIIPRWIGDGGGSMHTIVNKISEDSLEDVFKKINS